MKISSYVLLIFLFAFTTACDDLTGTSTGVDVNATNGNTSTVVGSDEGEGDQNSTTPIKPDPSDEKIIVKELLDGVVSRSSAKNFKLKFKLDEGETMKFFFYAKADLTKGVELSFSMVDGVVNLTKSLGNKEHTYELQYKDNIVDIEVDVHNDHSPTHVLIWEREGPFADSLMCENSLNCLFNTESYSFFGHWESAGNGFGTFWGFEGIKENLIEVKGPERNRSDA